VVGQRNFDLPDGHDVRRKDGCIVRPVGIANGLVVWAFAYSAHGLAPLRTVEQHVPD
jgi:hypothetical protein